jgi:hypothetical protein
MNKLITISAVLALTIIAGLTGCVAEPQPDRTVQEWADWKFGGFEPTTETGTGNAVVELPENVSGGVVRAEYSGEGAFTLDAIAIDGSVIETVIASDSKYSGTAAWGLNFVQSYATTFKVRADGPWTLNLSRYSTATELNVDGEKGDGGAVYLYDGPKVTQTITHDGADRFIMLQRDGSSDSAKLRVNEERPYGGAATIGAGPSVIAITGADSNWVVEPTK